ncbi:DDE-type integrase/transposase/recombinase [bacterium]|nr:DDE-type integrase/transposase/recombinase [bacterium]
MTDSPSRRDDDRAILLALFRYGVIAPLVEPDEFAWGEVSPLVKEIAAEQHYLPGTGPITVRERTIYAWKKAYKEGGIAALGPAIRKDRGRSRLIPEAVLQRAIQLRKEQPKRWTSTVLDILALEEALDPERPFHRATLDRHLAQRGASRRQLKTLGARRHIKMKRDHFGDLWVGDYHHGPVIQMPDGRVAPAKIGAFLDHCTRYPVSARYYPSEQIATLRDTLLRAFLRWGKASVVYVDRGSVYRAEQLAYSLLHINCKLVHSKAYYSEGRGLIERWWQLLKAFEDEVAAMDRLLTLHELNRYWEAFRERRYDHEPHSALGRTPAEAIAEVQPAPLAPEIARRLFLVRADRTVHKKDGCVAVEGRRFLCDSGLRTHRVQVRYDPNDLGSVEIFEDGQWRQTAHPQPINAPPEPHADEPERPSQSVEYLELVRQDYDRQLLEHARPLAYADLQIDDRFDESRFLAVVADLTGLDSRPATRRELSHCWNTFGPLPEDLVRIAVEHAVRLHGRGRHVRVYIHAIRTLVLAHWRDPRKDDKP